MIESLAFYKYQLLASGALGLACAGCGVFVLLRRQTMFAATMSQAGALAFALVFLWAAAFDGGAAHEVHAGINYQTAVLNVVLMFPFYVLGRRGFANFDAVLVAGFVFYSAVARILTVAGGLHTHLVVAYFGNILTVGVDDVTIALPVLGVCGVVFAGIFRSLVSVSFDADHARLSGIRVAMIEFLFFAILSVVAALTIRLMGSFYALAQLVVPAFFALGCTRSIRAALPVAAMYSLLATVGGFALSLMPISIAGQNLNLPTSSTIIVLLVLGCVPLALLRITKT